ARGAAFEIRATFRGAVPVQATIEYRFWGASPVEHLHEITRAEGAPEGLLVARLEPGHVQRNFRFQVRANDAVSDWREVEVLSRRQLVPFAGRPSPQIHVSYPAYTGLAAQELPDGGTSIEMIAGTQVALRAAVNRRLARAWLESPAELRSIMMVAACVAPLGNRGLAGTNLLAVAQGSTWKQIPARLEADGRVLGLDFVARIGGTFTLHFEDELGLENTRLVDLRIVMDPAPAVFLERPAPSHDSLDLLPDADVSLKVRAEDAIYAVRSV